MNVIRILPEKVVSQIAAGEVIERPASVVRELLDNSIDAGSDQILIRIDGGGKRYIRVSDNGVGMARDDLLLCLERHATSKISALPDLLSIRTLGFRGEALPSISSVSRMEITSRPADQLIGYRVKVHGGRLKSIDETGAPAGTVVEVKDLFFNMPARRKFLRTTSTENDHVLDTVTRIALPFTNISFRLEDREKPLLNLPSSERPLNRLSTLMGRHVAQSMMELNEEAEIMAIRGCLAPPDLSRSKADRLLIYVNRRNIRDRLLTRAMVEGYGQRLMKGRYPQALLFLEIDPSLIDVNVHPTKQEIRFHHAHLVYQTILSTIEKALGRRVYPVSNTVFEGQELESGEVGKMAISRGVLAEPNGVYAIGGEGQFVERKAGSKQEPLFLETPKIIGQLKDTYILCQTQEGLLMVDQHAAHERIVYETLKRSYGSSQLECQSFLIPQKLEFSLKEGRLLQAKLDQLAKWGLELEHFGGSAFLLRSVPSILMNIQWDHLVFDLISVLEEEADLSTHKAMDRMLTVMACHGAMRAGTRLSQDEMGVLLDQLEMMDLPTHCPHGRPIFKRLAFQEIERMFKRVV